jgi:hypothetical protein
MRLGNLSFNFNFYGCANQFQSGLYVPNGGHLINRRTLL